MLRFEKGWIPFAHRVSGTRIAYLDSTRPASLFSSAAIWASLRTIDYHYLGNRLATEGKMGYAIDRAAPRRISIVGAWLYVIATLRGPRFAEKRFADVWRSCLRLTSCASRFLIDRAMRYLYNRGARACPHQPGSTCICRSCHCLGHRSSRSSSGPRRRA